MGKATLVFLFILLGIGAQYFCYAVATDHAINWHHLNAFDWVLEIIWLSFLVCFALYIADE